MIFKCITGALFVLLVPQVLGSPSPGQGMLFQNPFLSLITDSRGDQVTRNKGVNSDSRNTQANIKNNLDDNAKPTTTPATSRSNNDNTDNNDSASNMGSNILKMTQIIPGNMFGDAIAKTLNQTQGAIESMTQPGNQFLNKLTIVGEVAEPEEEEAYYDREHRVDHKKPKFFSKDCNFRVACEVGRLLRPFMSPFVNIIETNKLVQDLQNRYTRAITYGMLKDNCNKYFCLMAQLMGGPQQFGNAVTEIVGRVTDPKFLL